MYLYGSFCLLSLVSFFFLYSFFSIGFYSSSFFSSKGVVFINLMYFLKSGLHFVVFVISWMSVGLMVLVCGVPFLFLAPLNGLMILFLAFSFWFSSYLRRRFISSRSFNPSSFSGLGVVLFDLFVVFLRPVTLTLRLCINVGLGHFLIDFICYSFSPLYLVFLLERFVYFVQSYVFVTLILSYILGTL